MKYVEYRDSIHNELSRNPAGLTWPELKGRLGLPYERPCPTWTKQLEADIGLVRDKGTSRALVWKVSRRGIEADG